MIIGVRLPRQIKIELGRICCGLAFVEWCEPDQFILILKHIEKVDSNTFLDIEEALDSVSYSPFSISLEYLGFAFAKESCRGRLWFKVEPSVALNKLIHVINRSLAKIKIKKEKEFIPYVPLATFEKLSTLRLAEYLERFGNFHSSPFEVNTFSLFTRHHAKETKNLQNRYEEQARYSLISNSKSETMVSRKKT